MELLTPKEKWGGVVNPEKKDPELDSDKDGMPDYWEIKNNLDANRNDAMETKLHNYYNNIEIYSHECI